MAEQRQELRKVGLKATTPRLKILQILEISGIRHLSAEDIYRQLLDAGEDIGPRGRHLLAAAQRLAGHPPVGEGERRAGPRADPRAAEGA